MGYGDLKNSELISGYDLEDAFNAQKFYPSSTPLTPTDKYLKRSDVVSYIDSLDTTNLDYNGITTNQYVSKQDLVEQSLVFTSYSGYTSPSQLLYYNPSGSAPRIYVADSDCGAVDKYLNPLSITKSNIYWFNPDNLDPDNPSTLPTLNYISHVVDHSYACKVDKQYNRLYLTGYTPGLSSTDTSTGLKIYDIATNTIKTVYYPSNTAFSRESINVLSNKLILGSGDGMYKVSRDSDITSTSTTATAITFSLRSGSTYPIVNKGSSILEVGSKLWITASGDHFVDTALGIYNNSSGTSFSLLSYITGSASPSDYTTIFSTDKPASSYGYSNYNRSMYYDEVNNKVYLSDLGTNTLTVFNSITETIIGYYTFDKSIDFSGATGTDPYYFDAQFVVNERNNDLILSGRLGNRVSPASGTQIYKSFILNRNCTNSSDIVTTTTYSTNFYQLITADSDRLLYGSFAGDFIWDGDYTTADGIIRQYGKISD